MRAQPHARDLRGQQPPSARRQLVRSHAWGHAAKRQGARNERCPGCRLSERAAPRCGNAPCKRMLCSAREGWWLFAPSLSGLGYYWLGAGGMHVTAPLDASLEGERGSFGQITNFRVSRGSHSRSMLSTWLFPGGQLQNTWHCSSPRVALLFAGSQSKQLTKRTFIPFIGVPRSFSAGDRSSPLSTGWAEPLAVPQVKAGIACLPPGCEAAAGHGLHRLSSHGRTSLLVLVKIPGVAAVGKNLFAAKRCSAAL